MGGKAVAISSFKPNIIRKLRKRCSAGARLRVMMRRDGQCCGRKGRASSAGECSHWQCVLRSPSRHRNRSLRAARCPFGGWRAFCLRSGR
jgi:hypothetical protein